MMLFYKLKRSCHFFINNFFYFLVFILGFFLGFIGKNILPQVLALEMDPSSCEYGSRTCFSMPTSDYSHIPSAYGTHQVLERLELIKELLDESIPEGYGYTIYMVSALNDSMDHFSRDWTSYLGVIKYKISDYLPRSEYDALSLDERHGHFTMSVIDSYRTGDQDFFEYSNFYSYSTSVSSNPSYTGWFLTTSLDQFKEKALSSFSNLPDWNFKNNSTSSGVGTKYLRSNTYFDFFLYYSSVDIEYYHTNDDSPHFYFNNKIYDTGDLWPSYYGFAEDNKSFLEDLTYTCSIKPFILSEKNDSESDYQKVETYGSNIYFDYDLPDSVWPYLFNFYNYYRASDYKELVYGSYMDSWNPFLWYSQQDDSASHIYKVPVTLLTLERKQEFFLGFSRVWELHDEDYTQLKDFQEWKPTVRDKYFLAFIKYLDDDFDMSLREFNSMRYNTLDSLLKSYYSSTTNNFVNASYQVIDSTIKADYLKFLLTVYNDDNFKEEICFYYDEDNLTLTYAEFSGAGTLQGCAWTNGQYQCFETDIDFYTSYDLNNFSIFDELRDALSYLSSLVDSIWNALPEFMKLTFITIFVITIIFIILRMVGWYG